ncbi:MAG: branched-chain amino acid ABC transporter permease, partial [Pseudomonadota bacterium]|nr:branched-chain amino acid ABC transporter permease [Pseudomonadota bacterium]
EAYRFWMMLVATMAILLGILVVIRSRIGLALAAIRDNEAAASALGVNPTRLKLLLFVAVGAATALVGAIGAFDESGLLPVKNFSLLEYTAFIIFIVVIGGIGSFEGPIIGTVIYFVADKVLTGLVGEYFYIVLGVIGILVMLFAPKGLWGLVQERTGFTLFPVRRHVIFGNEEQDA